MNALLDKPDTVVPTEQDAKLAAESSRILASQRPENEFRVTLDDGQVLTLPSAVKPLLSHLLTKMSYSHAVTLIPIHAELTTQEAADYLNVSRPYLVRLLEDGAMPFHKVGTHRRIRFQDLKTYKKRVDIERQKALEKLSEQAQELGMGY